jgi:hypothetical protein
MQTIYRCCNSWIKSGLAANVAATSALGVSLTAIPATLTGVEGTAATQGGEIGTLNSKTQFQTASFSNR